MFVGLVINSKASRKLNERKQGKSTARRKFRSVTLSSTFFSSSTFLDYACLSTSKPWSVGLSVGLSVGRQGIRRTSTDLLRFVNQCHRKLGQSCATTSQIGMTTVLSAGGSKGFRDDAATATTAAPAAVFLLIGYASPCVVGHPRCCIGLDAFKMSQ